MLCLTATGLISLCAFSVARADETIKFRLVMHATSAQTQEVGDVDGHTMTLIRYSGIASLADGSVGTANITAVADYIKGSGTYTGYYNVMLKDGSISYKATSILHGTGRFEGAKGEGTGSGTRLTPLAAGAELYVDVALNVKK
jgi:hypothetical protein